MVGGGARVLPVEILAGPSPDLDAVGAQNPMIGFRSGRAVAVAGLAVAVPAAGDPRRGDRLVFAISGDQQPGGDVEGRAGAGEQDQR